MRIMGFDIWVDADSVPQDFRQIVLKAASRLKAACFFVADRSLPDVKRFIADDTYSLRQAARAAGETDELSVRAIRSAVSMVVVESGADSADDYIVSNARPGSLCITHDIPLAARLLEKGCTVLDDRGGEYTAADIRSRLSDRLVNRELRSWGVFEQQQGRMGMQVRKAFADNLDRIITRLGKSEA